VSQNNPSEFYNQQRSKLTQIFRYVQAFNHLQNPIPQEILDQPWVLWFRNLPAHPCIRLGRPVGIASTTTANETETSSGHAEADFILKVRRPKLTEVPEPPKEIAAFLQNGWQNIDAHITIDPNIAPPITKKISTWRSRLGRSYWLS